MRALIIIALLCLLNTAIAINQPIDQPIDQSTDHRHARPHHSIDQPINQPIDQSLYESLLGQPYQVAYDQRSITINNQRALLLSGSIHYPRAPVSEWKSLFASARAAGLNTVQTYVFWNEHEDVQGELDFETESRNLGLFLQDAQDAGLFINLRIGPYVCAEWYYGGLPLWLRSNSSIQFRYDDPLWLDPVKTWVTYVTKYVEPYLARNGGPIILAQIENEYGGAGNDQHRQNYIWWCGNLTQQLAIDVPWVMCQQPDAPAPLIYACNGFYCHDYVAHQQSVVKMPAMWTENWPGWFQHWGEAKPRRPVEDVAYAMTLFIAAGGTYHNYYMWFGGYTYGKRQGGPGDLPSYDYDAPIDEYGVPHSPKYNHLKENHLAIHRYNQAILGNGYAKPVDLGNKCASYTYPPVNGYPGVIFAANTNPSTDCTVTISGVSFDLPYWSVTIIDMKSMTAVFNTHQFSAATNQATAAYQQLTSKPVWTVTPQSISQFAEPVNDIVNDASNNGPLEQLSLTLYSSMYLYYSTSINLNPSKQTSLSISNTNDYFYVFINDVQVAYHDGVGGATTLTFDTTRWPAGSQTLRIVVVLKGVTNGASYNSYEKKGLLGDVRVDNVDVINQQWNHSIGLWGEREKVYDPAAKHPWQPYDSTPKPWYWYELSFSLPNVANPDNATYYLTSGANKGHVYLNGRFLSPVWPSIYAPKSGCDPCNNYGGSYSSGSCRFDCSLPSQAAYQIPRDVLLLSPDGIQRVVIFSEQDGAIHTTTISQRT